jgi:hypothetical protein
MHWFFNPKSLWWLKIALLSEFLHHRRRGVRGMMTGS